MWYSSAYDLSGTPDVEENNQTLKISEIFLEEVHYLHRIKEFFEVKSNIGTEYLTTIFKLFSSWMKILWFFFFFLLREII